MLRSYNINLVNIEAPCPVHQISISFGKDRMAEADAVGLDYAIDTASVTDTATCQLFDLWYTGMCGARLHAKYLKPVSDEPVPLVLQFHGYPGASRSWFEQASFAGMGMALIALDCPGQGGPRGHWWI